MKIVLASTNPGKISEFQHLLAPLGWEIVPQTEFDIPAIEESGLTFIENAILKARHAAQITGLPALGDDSGLIVDVLNGAPGIYSARYAEKGRYIPKLLEELKNVPEEERTGRYYCVLIFFRSALDQTPIVGEGVLEGKILFAPQGEHGFGYDPVFYIPNQQCSVAELTLDMKNKISHRAKAVQNFMKKLHSLGLAHL